MSELDDIAQDLYGVNYGKLSPFGQYAVNLEVQASRGIKNYEQDKLIQTQASRIEELELNNKELWKENEELHLQLEEQKEEEDERIITRSTGSREAETSSLDSGSSTPLDALRGRDDFGLPGQVRPGTTD